MKKDRHLEQLYTEKGRPTTTEQKNLSFGQFMGAAKKILIEDSKRIIAKEAFISGIEKDLEQYDRMIVEEIKTLDDAYEVGQLIEDRQSALAPLLQDETDPQYKRYKAAHTKCESLHRKLNYRIERIKLAAPKVQSITDLLEHPEVFKEPFNFESSDKKLIEFKDFFKTTVSDEYLNNFATLLNTEQLPKRIAHLIIFLDMEELINYPRIRTKLYRAIEKQFSIIITAKNVNNVLSAYEIEKTKSKKYDEITEIDFAELNLIKKTLSNN